MSFGERLRQERLRRHLTQEALAEALGTSSKTISRWEQDLAIPRSYAKLQLARFFELPSEEFFEDLEPQAPLARLWTVPFPRHPFFTGREELLRTLATRLNIEQPIALTQAPALSGLGGIGKTQVAVEYAYRFASEYRAVFWLAAETQESLMRSLMHIAEQLYLPQREAAQQAQMVEAVQQWLATHPGWLLIADNVQELDLLQRVLPPIREGALLITTRRQALGPLAEPLEVPPMSNEEGIVLLLRRSRQLDESTPGTALAEGTALPSAVAAEASELAKLLGGLPLALDQAGAYIEETGCCVAEYLQRCRSQRKHILARRGLHGGAHPDSVSTTLSLSVQRIAQQHPVAEDLLHLCAFLHPEAIPEEMLIAGASHLGPRLGSVVADPYQFDLTLAALRSASLISRFPQTKTLSVHRLVQAVLLDQMEPAEEQQWSERVLRTVNAAFPEGEADTWVQCERSLAHALACIPLIEATGNALPEAGELLHKAGSYLVQRGRYGEAEPLVEQALALAEQQPDQAVLISRLEGRAELFWKQGKYGYAEALLQRVLQFKEQQLGLTHPQTAVILNDLGVLYWSQGKEGAEPLYQRSLRIQEQQLGPDHLETAETLHNLALFYWSQGKYEEAEPLYQRVLSIKEQQLGPDHPGTAETLHNLGVLYSNQGKREEAKHSYQRALRIREQQLGSDHPAIILNLNNLAILYWKQGEYEEAEQLCRRSLSICERHLGLEHPDTAHALNGLATLYRDQGKYEEAEPLYQRALDIYEQYVGPEHIDTAHALRGLAILYYKQGKYKQAELLFQQVLGIREQHLEPGHPSIANSLTDLTNLYRDQGKYEQAKPLYQRALAISEQRLGATHPQTRRIRDDYHRLLEPRTSGSQRADEEQQDHFSS